MRTSRNLIATILLVLVFWVRISASMYCGTITETITSTNDPSYELGQQMVGTYQYDSPTADGVFGSVWYSNQAPEIATTLSGDLFGFFGRYSRDGMIDFESSHITTRLRLVVAGGIVKNFATDGEIGSLDYSFLSDSFSTSWWDASANRYYRTGGTLTFSIPVSVTEVTGTVALLAFGLLVIPLVRRRT